MPAPVWDKIYGWVDPETGDQVPGGPSADPPQGYTLNTPPNAAGQRESIDYQNTVGGRQPNIPTNRSMVPVPDSGFEAAPPNADSGFVAAPPRVNPTSILGGLARRVAPWAGRILGPPGALIGSTTPAETGEFHPRVRPDIALGGKPTGIPFPSGPGYGQGPFAGQPAPVPSDSGYGQGPFAGRPDAAVSGVGQGPFAGRPDTVTGGPDRSPSGPVAAPPAVSPAAAAPSAVAAQRPNLGYYTFDRPNLPQGQQGGRGGPSQTQMGMFGFDPKGPLFGLGAAPAAPAGTPYGVLNQSGLQARSKPIGALALTGGNALPGQSRSVPVPVPPPRPVGWPFTQGTTPSGAGSF